MHRGIQEFPLWQQQGNITSLKTSGDLMELNDMELNNINFGDETNSDGAANNSDEIFLL